MVRPVLSQVSAPDPGTFSGYDDFGVAAILVFVIFFLLANFVSLGVLFYRRVIVWGSTCDLLVENEAKRADLKEQEADEWKADVKQLAFENNANLQRALTLRDELTRRGGKP